MSASLEEVIDVLQPHLPEVLVNTAQLNSIRTISAFLPPLSFGCFECFFGNKENRVDFNIAITGNLNEHLFFSTWEKAVNIFPEESLRDSLYKAKTFCAKWGDKNFPLKALLDDFWLVFDITNSGTRSILPWHYVRFATLTLNNDPQFKKALILQTLLWLNEPVTDLCKSQLEHFFNNLPPGTLVSAVGMQRNRNIDLLRLYLVFNNYADILLFLGKNNWPGNREELHVNICEFAAGCNAFGLAIDMGSNISETIGIEFWYDEKDSDKLDLALHRLVEKKLCTAAEKTAYLDWPGEFELISPGGFWSWPQNFIKPDNLLQKITIKKRAPYFKVVYQSGKPINAKGYLYFDRLVFNGNY